MHTDRHFPATLVKLPEGCSDRRASFYLAAEEWVAEKFVECNDASPLSYLFTWQLGPTVVMGRNQVLEQEVDVDFCHTHNIYMVRRHSGGGAIYADMGNIMISLITDAGSVESLFEEYSNAVASLLQSLGAPAVVSGRNDIMLSWSNGSNGSDGLNSSNGKVCGNAFYHRTKSNIVHGTMLYDTDYDLMLGALRPPMEKLKRHGVESVRQRTTLLKDCLSIGIGQLRSHIEHTLTSSVVSLSAHDVQQIEKIEQNYYNL